MSYTDLKMEIITLLASVDNENQLMTIKNILAPAKEKPSTKNLIDSTSKWNIDSKKIVALIARANQKEKEMGQLKMAKDRVLIEAIEMIRRAVVDWRPAYNEKAVCIYLETQTAWHLWRVESYRENYLRFKEAPAEIDRFNNYSNINLSEPFEQAGYIIVPKAFFEELNEYLPFTLYPDKHIKYGGNINTEP